MTEHQRMTAIREAAFRLAERKPWREVTLSEIAAEAGLSLAETAGEVAGKGDILRAFSKRDRRRASEIA